jgi:hypothetical protein
VPAADTADTDGLVERIADTLRSQLPLLAAVLLEQTPRFFFF